VDFVVRATGFAEGVSQLIFGRGIPQTMLLHANDINADALDDLLKRLEARDVRGIRVIEDALGDLRYAARIMRNNRAFTISAVLTFALGIGATTSIYSVVYGVLLRPLPYERPDRLVTVWERDLPRSHDRNVASLDNYDAWRTRARSVTGMAALMPTSVTIEGGPAPERVSGAEVSSGYFELLGVPPALGRDFDADAAREGDAIILSDGFWKRHFGTDPAIVGRTMTMAGKTYTVAGVMPPTFDPPRFGWLGAQEIWFPLVDTPEKRGWGRFLLVVARLRDDVTVEQARAEMIAIARQREAEAAANKEWSASVVPLAEQITGDSRTTLLVLLAAVALLLVMAVTNVATLTSSTMRRRGQELAVRRALGATDRRLFRQLFLQSALLAVLGTLMGLLAAPFGVQLPLYVLPPDIPRASAIRVDMPVLLATSAAAMLATLVFGTAAAARGRSSSVVAPLAQISAENRATARPGGGTLVAVEVALALALSVMAVLMVRSLVSLRTVDLGFQPGGVAIARIALPGDRYASDASQRAFFGQLLERVRALPGVTAAGIISNRPLGGLGPATTVRNPLVQLPPGSVAPVADIRYADAAAFKALRVPLIAGSLDYGREAGGAPPRVIVSADLARQLWPHGDAVGRRVAISMYGGITPEVVGVVGDVHLVDPRTPSRPAAYLSASAFPDSIRDLVVRTDGAPESLFPSLRSAVAAIDRALPLYQVATLPSLVDEALAADRFTTFLLVAFAIAALLLAGVGIFGVLVGDVDARRREIGIRLALGAPGSRVVLLLLGQATRRATVGMLVGSVAALSLARTMKALLFGVRPADPFSFAVVAAVVLVVVLTATLIPAITGIRISPLSTLREN
jgi:predicted permease